MADTGKSERPAHHVEVNGELPALEVEEREDAIWQVASAMVGHGDEELIARIEALSRRHQATPTGTTMINRFASLVLDVSETEEAPDVEGAATVATLCRKWGLAMSAQERFWVISYDARRNARTVVEVAVGSWDQVSVPIPAVAAAVLLAGTDRFMVAHNHPPGDLSPTVDDIALTEHIAIAAAYLGLYFEDHLILGPDNGFFSMVAGGMMRPRAFPSSHADGSDSLPDTFGAPGDDELVRDDLLGDVRMTSGLLVHRSDAARPSGAE